jgi:hypothetical protein
MSTDPHAILCVTLRFLRLGVEVFWFSIKERK